MPGEDAIDSSFRTWIEELALPTVEAIGSDETRKRAIAVLTGGLTVGGLTTPPFAPADSASLAGILLTEQRDTESEHDTDSDAARIERATRLLAHMNTIMQAWLWVLQAQASRIRSDDHACGPPTGIALDDAARETESSRYGIAALQDLPPMRGR